MNISKFIKKHTNQFRKGQENVDSKRKQWESFAKRAKDIFEKVIKESDQQGLFENLYIVDSSGRRETIGGQSSIRLFWGAHPTGIVEKEFEPFREEPIKTKNIIEKGGALQFSQTVRGDVLVTLFPVGSEIY